MGFDDYIGGADLQVEKMHKGDAVEKWFPITQHKAEAGEVLVRIKLH